MKFISFLLLTIALSFSNISFANDQSNQGGASSQQSDTTSSNKEDKCSTSFDPDCF